MIMLKLSYFGHIKRRPRSLKKAAMLLKGRKEKRMRSRSKVAGFSDGSKDCTVGRTERDRSSW